MRTWSVSGTAFALWTRSSSLSMRTRTSMSAASYSCGPTWKSGLLAGVLGRPGPSVREEHLEPLRDRRRHELRHVAAERRDLLHAARRDEAHLRARHHVHRLDLRRELAVELVHLELPLEVRDDAQALDDHLRVPLAREVDDELGEAVDLDVVVAGERLLQERDALVEREHRLLVLRGADDADDDTVE